MSKGGGGGITRAFREFGECPVETSEPLASVLLPFASRKQSSPPELKTIDLFAFFETFLRFGGFSSRPRLMSRKRDSATMLVLGWGTRSRVISDASMQHAFRLPPNQILRFAAFGILGRYSHRIITSFPTG